MTCTETREYLFAFLDNELDAPLSIELQRHLERCPDCAREAEIERTIHKQLVGTLNTKDDVAPFDETCLTETPMAIAPHIGGSHPRRARRAMLLAASIALISLVGIGLWASSSNVKTRASLNRNDHFADLLVADFQHFLQEGQPLQLASANANEVSDWLKEQTHLSVSMSTATNDRSKLLGARKCTISGQAAAFALYDLEGDPVSLVAVASKYVDLSRMQRIEKDNQIHWVDHCKDHTVVARASGDLLYAAVSKLPEDELVHFITGVVLESD